MSGSNKGARAVTKQHWQAISRQHRAGNPGLVGPTSVGLGHNAVT
jgi:hypothetical protein